jgi:type IV pilus assembly protein PilB
MQAHLKLGEILVRAGVLTVEQVEAALDRHRGSKLRLGKILVMEGLVAESQIVEILARQLKIERYRPESFPLDPRVAELVPAETAQRFMLAPLRQDGPLLTVAVTDPLNVRAQELIERRTGCEVAPVICSEEQVLILLRTLYPSYGGISDLLSGMGEMKIDTDGDHASVSEEIGVTSLKGMAEGAPIVTLVSTILSQAIRDGASDIHITPARNHVRLRFRLDGKLIDMPALGKPMFLPMVSRLKILSGMDIAVSRKPQDGRFTVRAGNRDINIRTSTIPSIHGENMVLRLLDMSSGIYSLDRLGMEPGDCRKVEAAVARPYGMILSTGPTGSGKSTSLYAMLKGLNRPDVNIVTVEDPVEYRIDGITQIPLDTRAGMTFATGMRSILRQDPDVIMVGEIRDLETARIAVQAALTGHRVFSTLHTNDAAGAVSRLLDMGLEPFLVSSVLTLVIAQRLVRKVCQSCQRPVAPPEEVLKAWGLAAGSEHRFFAGAGCATCLQTGYRGRTGIFEHLEIDDAVRTMILERRSSGEIARAARETGRLAPLWEKARRKVAEGLTTFEEAASAVML